MQLHEVLVPLLEQKLKQFAGHDLNLHSCVLIYQEIFGTISDIVINAGVQISNEAVNYIAQQFYDGAKINNKHVLDPNIFTQRAKLENIETEELKVVALLLKGTDFLPPIVTALKKR